MLNIRFQLILENENGQWSYVPISEDNYREFLKEKGTESLTTIKFKKTLAFLPKV